MSDNFLMLDENYSMPNSTRPTTPNPDTALIPDPNGPYGPGQVLRLGTTNDPLTGHRPGPDQVFTQYTQAELQDGTVVPRYNPMPDHQTAVCALTRVPGLIGPNGSRAQLGQWAQMDPRPKAN